LVLARTDVERGLAQLVFAVRSRDRIVPNRVLNCYASARATLPDCYAAPAG
jgi:hypothetical protein